MASSASGNGPNWPSFDASLTTRSSPSSRCTSSTGLPGSYGTRSLTAGLKKRSAISASVPATAENLTARAGALAEIADLFFKPAVNDLVPYEPGKPVEEGQRELGFERGVKLASNEGHFGSFPE